MASADAIIPFEAQRDAQTIWRGEYDIALKEEPRTILDIGANAGLFTLWAMRRWPTATITAYEPWPENARMFRNNINGSDRVTFHEAGVRLGDGRHAMHADQNAMMRSFHSDIGIACDVDCVSASAIPSAEFVKIDTEGSEVEIVKGLDTTKTKAIVLEAHSTALACECEFILRTKGFRLSTRRPSVNGCSILKFVKPEFQVVTNRVMVAVPMYGGVEPFFVESLLRLVSFPSCDITIRTVPGDSLVARARNTLAADFLRSDCSHMLFIDSDLVFSPEHVARIVAHKEDLVGGFYPKKYDSEEVQWVCNALEDRETTPREDGLQEVRYMGTGFLRIARTVLEQMAEAYPELAFHPDTTPENTDYDFFSTGVYRKRGQEGPGRYLSEDWYFCQRWLDLGGKVWGDTKIILKHVGHAVYPLKSQTSSIIKPQ